MFVTFLCVFIRHLSIVFIIFASMDIVQEATKEMTTKDELVDAGLVSERNALIYLIKKRYKEYSDNMSYADAVYNITVQYPVSEHTVKKYLYTVKTVNVTEPTSCGCGKNISDSFNFCPFCGKEIN